MTDDACHATGEIHFHKAEIQQTGSGGASTVLDFAAAQVEHCPRREIHLCLER